SAPLFFALPPMTVSAESPEQTDLRSAQVSREEALPDLSIVIPALNEQQNLELLLPLISDTIKQLQLEAEVIVVDGGSHDDSKMVARKLGARVVEQTERGFGGALLAGFAAARAGYVITMDADLSHPPEFLKDFWQHRKESDLIVASRFVPGGQA